MTSKIEWTDETWNPTTGCTKVSAGCKHCYAERIAERLQSMNSPRYVKGFNLALHDDLIDKPRHWRKGRMIFVNSMSDLFHKSVPSEFIERVFNTMNECPQHIFQVLTKRSDRARKFSERVQWSDNIWMGVSVENKNFYHRIADLVEIPARVRFLSCESLLAPLDDLPLDDIHWCIVGGESGPKARPMEASWVRSIKSQCRSAEVPFFFKQWGGVNKKKTGRLLDGKEYDELPFLPLLKTINKPIEPIKTF